MKVAALAGGIGAARFLRGLVRVVEPADISVIGNVGDDIELYGLHVSPDLDSITYWLAGAIHPEQQWGRADESFVVAAELERFGEPRWFTLGDRDLATHLYRTRRLRDGAPLSAVTAEITRAFGLTIRLVPATDDPVQTRVTTADGRDLHFQEWWVGEHATSDLVDVRLVGASDAKPGPGVIEALEDADVILLCPSNPVVSIGTILDIPGIREALVAATAPVVGVSPIVGGRVVRGMADRLLPVVGVETTAAGVARHYAAFLDGWVVDRVDAVTVAALEADGIRAVATDTLLDDPEVAATVARTALDLAEACR